MNRVDPKFGIMVKEKCRFRPDPDIQIIVELPVPVLKRKMA
jgi:hypothetical protein